MEDVKAALANNFKGELHDDEATLEAYSHHHAENGTGNITFHFFSWLCVFMGYWSDLSRSG